jgi:hypothetical protein
MSDFYKLHKKNKVHSNGDGYITRDGHTMFQQDIVSDLNNMRLRLKQKAELAEAAEEMLEMLVHNAPIEGLYESMVEDWGIMLEQGKGE